MKKIYVVTPGAHSRFIFYQLAFINLEDAEFMRAHLDKGKGASSPHSTIHILMVYDCIEEALGDEE